MAIDVKSYAPRKWLFCPKLSIHLYSYATPLLPRSLLRFILFIGHSLLGSVERGERRGREGKVCGGSVVRGREVGGLVESGEGKGNEGWEKGKEGTGKVRLGEGKGNHALRVVTYGILRDGYFANRKIFYLSIYHLITYGSRRIGPW